ncbi:hypothetical protein M3Y99_00481200 [Aphelenchoides fujianensis]|nr:hypothetical protein M3Y99_00481200 [Aphelenchoides fujianensis]
MPPKSAKQQKKKGGQPVAASSASTGAATAASTSHDGGSSAAPSKSTQPTIPHRNWVQYPQVQSELFYECTLFLYSILALFLEYLNLYKTLWWLPKSHWHTVFKLNLINPYVLSCIGLILGIRVTMCFWSTITQKFSEVNVDDTSVLWSITEYAGIKSPLGTMVASSFVFSFSKIIGEYGYISLVYLLLPVVVYLVMFFGYIRDGLQQVHRRWVLSGAEWWYFFHELWYFEMPSQYPRLLDSKHVCDADDRKEYWREALILDMELRYRFSSCLYAAFFTAYFSIFLPSRFVPMRTLHDHQQVYLSENYWCTSMCVIVFVTSFFLYALYRFPPELLDRLYMGACHLGTWTQPTDADLERCPNQGYCWENGRVVRSFEEWDASGKAHYKHDTIISVRGAEDQTFLFKSERHPHFDRVASSPCSPLHERIYKLGKDPTLWIRYACIAQVVLIVCQFHALVMATDWQHIFTLVMLMFANYVLVGKYFKDYVIFSFIYADDRKTPEGASMPLNGRHLNEKGEFEPEPND